MPFDEDEDVPTPQKKGVKLNRNNSILSSIPKKPNIGAFEKNADKEHHNQEDYKKRGFDLAIKYRDILQNKVLKENKNSIAVGIEEEILLQLIQLGEDINTDQNELESQGSIALIAMLLKCLLLQRDNINSIEYKLEKIEKDIKNIFLKFSSNEEK